MAREEKSFLIVGSGIMKGSKERLSEKEFHSLHYPEDSRKYKKNNKKSGSQSSKHDASWTKKIIDENYRKNRRITFKLCWPMIDENESLFYCAFVQLPGNWLASCVRLNWEKRIFPPDESYDSQSHAAESCYRHLLRYDFEEKYVGNCYYSITFYEQFTRISIPYHERFMILLNAEPEFLVNYQELFDCCFDKFVEDKDDILKLCKHKLQNISRNELLHNYFSQGNDDNELVQKFRNCFQENTMLKNNKNLNFKILYAALGKSDGTPIVRYEKDVFKRKLVSYDEFEFFIEATTIQNQRKKQQEKLQKKQRETQPCILDGVKYTISVYEKLVEITYPIDDHFMLVVVLDHEDKDKPNQPDQELSTEHGPKNSDDIFFQEPMESIFNSIYKRDWSYILAEY